MNLSGIGNNTYKTFGETPSAAANPVADEAQERTRAVAGDTLSIDVIGSASPVVRRTLTLTFGQDSADGEPIVLPEEFKQTLAKVSVYFQNMFEKGFIESKKDAIDLQDINKNHFTTILQMIRGDGANLAAYNLTQLMKLAEQANYLQMPAILKEVSEKISKKIAEMSQTPENLEFCKEVLSRLPELGNDRRIREGVAAFRAGMTSTIQGYDDLLLFLKYYGEEITSLEIRVHEPITKPQLEGLFKLCPHLDQLIISILYIDDKTIEIICTLYPKMKKLDLSHCINLTDNGLGPLAKLSALQTLELHNCPKLTDKGLIHIGKLDALHMLTLSNLENLTDKGSSYISKLKSLETLDFTGCERLTGDTIPHLQKLSSLKKLSLFKCPRIFASDLIELTGLEIVRR